MRLIDAVSLSEGIDLHRQSTDQKCEMDRQWAVVYNAGLDRALYSIAYAKTITPSPNDPLTLEDLREMDGEPVWVVEINGYPPRWGLIYWFRKNKRDIVYVTINNGASICAETSMAAGVRFYRRKPEEETL